MRRARLLGGDAGWCAHRVDVRLDDECLEKDSEQSDERERPMPPRRGCRSKVAVASAPPDHDDVILYHSRLMQTPKKTAASSFDKQP